MTHATHQPAKATKQSKQPKPPRNNKSVKSDDLSRADFKARVKEYFEMNAKLNEARKIDGGYASPLTVPGLAAHLVWPVEKLCNYPADGKFYDIVEYALVQLESFLNEAIFTKRIDKSIGAMMLKSYFGYSDKEERRKILKESRRSISRVLDDIEKNV